MSALSLKRVLVVENHVELAESIKVVLSDLLGYEVHTALDGKQGVREALRLRPDVVVPDLCLPLVDGLELGRQVRAALLAVTMVAMSGFADPRLHEWALASGFDRYVSKPMDLAALLRALAP